MWPFNRGGKIAVTKNEGLDLAEQLVRQLATWRPIGEKFEYLGRTMVVTAHHIIDVSREYPLPQVRLRPVIQANYADELGVIRSITFGTQEAVALMLAQPMTPKGES